MEGDDHVKRLVPPALPHRRYDQLPLPAVHDDGRWRATGWRRRAPRRPQGTSAFGGPCFRHWPRQHYHDGTRGESRHPDPLSPEHASCPLSAPVVYCEQNAGGNATVSGHWRYGLSKRRRRKPADGAGRQSIRPSAPQAGRRPPPGQLDQANSTRPTRPGQLDRANSTGRSRPARPTVVAGSRAGARPPASVS